MREQITSRWKTQIVKSISDCSQNSQVLFSGIINQADGNYNEKISEINTRMASYSEGQGVIFINNNTNDNINNNNNNNDNNNDNIDCTCLNRDRLLLNKKSYSNFYFNLNELIKSIWLDVIYAAQLTETSGNISLRKSIYEAIKCLGNENPSNVFSYSNINSIR